MKAATEVRGTLAFLSSNSFLWVHTPTATARPIVVKQPKQEARGFFLVFGPCSRTGNGQQDFFSPSFLPCCLILFSSYDIPFVGGVGTSSKGRVYRDSLDRHLPSSTISAPNRIGLLRATERARSDDGPTNTLSLLPAHVRMYRRTENASLLTLPFPFLLPVR